MKFKAIDTYPVEQCCAENGVPDNCLGLCVEQRYADWTPRKIDLDRFNSVCDKYQDIVHNCTVFPRPPGECHMHHNKIFIIIKIL